VRIFVNVKSHYMAVIRENTRFWQVSGTRIEGGIFSGVTISTESLTAFIRGGISLATPDAGDKDPPVTAGHLFPLHAQAEKQWLDWQPNITLLETPETDELPLKKQ